MLGLISLLLLVAAAIAVALAVRLTGVRSELESLRRSFDQQQRQLAALTRRVWLLEGSRVDEPGPAALAQPAVAQPVLEPAPAPEALVEMPPPVEPVAANPRVDWETRLGANWLNRAGALVLVVGVVLFLGYSLTQMGPLGKVAIGFAVGLSLLLGGMALERQDSYRGFSISLMAAGWAVVYFTAYAMHGVPAARVIEDPGIAVVLLLLVPAGMIAHALRYRSEAAVGLAYLFGFVSLNISPLTPYSVIASLVLALSLVGLACRLDWLRLPVAGVVFTYVTFVLRYDPAVYGRPGVLNGLSTLWIYWLAFEAFDLLQLRRGRGRQSLFLLNACGFAGASLLHEWRMKAEDWSWFLGAAALAYLASAWLRSRWTWPAEDGRPEGYEAASTISAAFLAGALIMRFSGLQITVALLFEGELIVLAGAALGSTYLRYLGTAVLALPFFRILAIDAPEAGRIDLAGMRLEHWTPAGVLMAAVFALNRKAQPSAWFYAAGAGVLVFAVLLVELPALWVAPVWAALAVGAYLSGDRFSQRDLLWMSVPAAAFGFGRAAVVNIDKGAVLTTGLTVLLLYAMQFLWRVRMPLVATMLSVCATVLTVAVLINEVQGRLLTVAFGIQGAALLTAGFMIGDRVLRVSGLVLFLACIAKLFAYDLRELDTMSRILSFLVLGLMLLGASWLYTRYRDKLTKLL